MGTFKEGRGSGAQPRNRTLSQQFTIKKLCLEVTDWAGNLMVIRSDNAWATQHVVIPEEGGSLQEVGRTDAGASNGPRPSAVQDPRQQELFNEELEREKASQAGFPTKPSKPSKQAKQGVKRNAKKAAKPR